MEWLEKVPIEWAVLPGRRVFRQTRDSSFEEDEQLSASQKHGVLPQSLLMKLEDQKVVLALKGTDGFIHVDEDDFVISLRSFQGGIEHSQYTGCVSPAYTVLKASKPICPRYYFYTLKTRLYIGALQSVTDGIRDGKNISYDQFGLVALPVPPLADQTAIAAFLDRETAKIDALVEAQRRLIALLKEKRQAVISHAVTKGIDPNAPMKDSGIDWLGDVPAHWEVRRIKSILKGIGQGWSPQCDSEPVDSPEQWGVLKVGCVNGGHFNPCENKSLPPELEPIPELAVRAGDVLVSRANTRELVGGAALVMEDHPRLLLCDKLYRLIADNNQVEPGYLATYLQADVARGQIQVAASGASSSMLNIGQFVIRDMPIAIPPLVEQQSILKLMGQRRNAFDLLISQANAVIALLQERRAALISAAVTGKIDVRGSAKVLAFPIDRARARGLIAAEIIERSAQQRSFGRVKLQKIAFLAEAHVGVGDLAGTYTREAAGPLDRAMIDDMEREAGRLSGIVAEQPDGSGTPVTYRLGPRRGSHRQELASWLGAERQAKLDKLIDDFATIETKGAEAVATLYAVWNDALIAGQSPDDAAIIAAFLTDWHPEKPQKFRAEELHHWLDWMRRHGLVPTGRGPKTETGRLFV